MIKRRIIAAVVAILLATVGGVLLLSYVARADQRALAGLETTDVLVVTGVIAKGTAAEQVAKLVTTKKLPAMSVAPGSVASLAEVSGKVASTDLQPGEQVLASRFVDPATLRSADEVEIPAGLSQVSLLLDSQRVVGGQLTPGSTVGVLVSLPEKGSKMARTKLALHRVLVARVSGGVPPASSDGEEASDAPSQQPSGSVMVTLAVNAADAEKIVFAAEHGTIWLAQEPMNANTSGTRIVTESNVYR